MSFAYCEVDDSKLHCVTEAYEHALQLAHFMIQNGHCLTNATVFGRLSFISQISFVS